MGRCCHLWSAACTCNGNSSDHYRDVTRICHLWQYDKGLAHGYSMATRQSAFNDYVNHCDVRNCRLVGVTVHVIWCALTTGRWHSVYCEVACIIVREVSLDTLRINGLNGKVRKLEELLSTDTMLTVDKLLVEWPGLEVSHTYGPTHWIDRMRIRRYPSMCSQLLGIINIHIFTQNRHSPIW